MREDELEIAPQRLGVGVAGLAAARAQRVLEPVEDEAELGPQRLPLAVRAPQHDGARQLLRVLGERILELLGHRDPQRRVRERPREPVHPRPQQAQRGRPVQLERAGQRVRTHLGVPVHVAARPRAIRQDRLHQPHAEVVLDLVQHRRDGVEQHRLEEEQVAADLVLDLRPHPPQLVGLPPDGQHLAQLVEQHPPAYSPDARVIQAVEQRRDVPLMVEHGPARGLGRVRGQHMLDLQLRGQRGDVDRAVAQDLRRLGERLALDLTGLVVLPAPPHALALLGDVRELELQRTRADDRLDGLVRHLAQVGDEPFDGRVVAGPDRGGGAEQPLHAGREHASCLFLEHAVERAGQQLRVVGKAVGRQHRRHVKASHGPREATKPCPRRRCRWWTRRRG